VKLYCVLFLLLFCLPGTGYAKKKSTPLPAAPHAAVDRDYISALSAANHFLQAWQAEDHEAGLLLLTDSAKEQTSSDRLEKYFSPEVALRAYTIAKGTKLRQGRYVFAVTLIEQSAKAPTTRSSQIIAVHTGKDDWAIDKLP
jgi:hypothetical protein